MFEYLHAFFVKKILMYGVVFNILLSIKITKNKAFNFNIISVTRNYIRRSIAYCRLFSFYRKLGKLAMAFITFFRTIMSPKIS